MISKKTLKKISKVIFVLLIILWFGGNLAIYIFAEYMFSNTLDIINSQPEKKTISENTNPANSFHILGVSLDLLPITNIYKNVVPFFHDHKMRDLSISFSDSQKIFFIHMLDYDDSNSWDTCDKSFYARAKDFLMIKESNWYDYIWASEQVTMNDFSWWNPIHNIRLTMLLIVKRMKSGKNNKVYELETPHFKGILTQSQSYSDKHYIIEFIFFDGTSTKSMDFIVRNELALENVLQMIASIKKVDNTDESFKVLEKMRRNKEFDKYPEELVLLSMMSLKGVKIELLNELSRVIKEKKYHDMYINWIEDEIKYYSTLN